MLELIPYLAVAIVAPFLTYIAAQSSPTHERHAGIGMRMLLNPFDLGSVAILIAFAGTRVNIGTDYPLYRGIYEILDPDDWAFSIAWSQQDPGFTVLSLALKSLGLSTESFLFAISALTVSAVYVAIRFASPAPAFSILLYILFAAYLGPMNVARQGLAVAFTLLAVVFASRSRVIALAAIGFACAMHSSAIIAAALFLFLRYVRVGLIGFLVSIIGVVVAGRLLLSLPVVVNLLGSFNERYVTYLGSEEAAGSGTILVSAIHATLVLAFLRIKDLSAEETWWRNIYMLTAPLALFGTTVLFAVRLADYAAALLPLVAEAAARRSKSPAVARGGIVCVGLGFYIAYLLNYGGLIPYQTLLFPTR